MSQPERMSNRSYRYSYAYFEELSGNYTNEPGSRDEDRLLRAVAAGDRAVCYRDRSCGLEPDHVGPCQAT